MSDLEDTERKMDEYRLSFENLVLKYLEEGLMLSEARRKARREFEGQ